MTELPTHRRRIDKVLAEWNYLRKQIRDEKENLEVSKGYVASVESAQHIFQGIAQSIQQRAHERIARVVSRAFEAIFDDPYTFRIDFEQKRGKTEAIIVFERGELEADPNSASGVGVIDVAAFALRLACLMLTQPQPRRLIVMDEPFRFLNGEVYQERAGRLIQAMARETGFQFIIVSDDDWIKLGKVIEI